MELVLRANELMPEGKPKYLEMINYPQVADLVKTEGKKKMLAVLTIMVKDFCSSLNVVRNMNEDQIIETAAMMLEECENFRLEDFMMMFTMAKRGKLVKIMDRIDIQLVSEMMDQYWLLRNRAGKEAMEQEINRYDSMGNTTRQLETLHPEDVRLVASSNKLSGALEEMRTRLTEWKNEEDAR